MHSKNYSSKFINLSTRNALSLKLVRNKKRFNFVCLNKKYTYNAALVSLCTVFVTDMLQNMDPPGPLLSKNWGVRTPSIPLWMRLWHHCPQGWKWDIWCRDWDETDWDVGVTVSRRDRDVQKSLETVSRPRLQASVRCSFLQMKSVTKWWDGFHLLTSYFLTKTFHKVV